MARTDDGSAAPTLAAGVVIIDAERRVLLMRQNYGRRLWSIPGGVIEPGESPQDAAVREAREETGLEVELDHLIGVYTVRERGWGYRFHFRATVSGGELIATPTDEVADLGWWPVDGLPEPITVTAPHGVSDALAGLCGVAREV